MCTQLFPVLFSAIVERDGVTWDVPDSYVVGGDPVVIRATFHSTQQHGKKSAKYKYGCSAFKTLDSVSTSDSVLKLTIDCAAIVYCKSEIVMSVAVFGEFGRNTTETFNLTAAGFGVNLTLRPDNIEERSASVVMTARCIDSCKCLDWLHDWLHSCSLSLEWSNESSADVYTPISSMEMHDCNTKIRNYFMASIPCDNFSLRVGILWRFTRLGPNWLCLEARQ